MEHMAYKKINVFLYHQFLNSNIYANIYACSSYNNPLLKSLSYYLMQSNLQHLNHQ